MNCAPAEAHASTCVGREHRAGADDQPAVRGHRGDRIQARRRAQRDLGRTDAAVGEGRGELTGAGGIVDHDDRDDARDGEGLDDGRHRPSQPPSTGRTMPDT